jgi:hypothetical protein
MRCRGVFLNNAGRIVVAEGLAKFLATTAVKVNGIDMISANLLIIRVSAKSGSIIKVF